MCLETSRSLSIILYCTPFHYLDLVDSRWNVMAHGDAREGKWRRNWQMECVASTLLTTSEHGLSNITTADAHTSAASSRLNWRLRRFKWVRPFRRKTKSGFCACAITFQLASTYVKALACVTSCAHLSACVTRYVALYGPKQVCVSRHNLYQISSKQFVVTSCGNDLVSTQLERKGKVVSYRKAAVAYVKAFPLRLS